MRFAVARQEGFDEDQAALVDDGYEHSALDERYRAALAFADAFLQLTGPPPPEVRARIQAQLSDAELTELGIGLALFHGFSKLLIALGCEPEEMATTVLPTPDVRG